MWFLSSFLLKTRFVVFISTGHWRKLIILHCQWYFPLCNFPDHFQTNNLGIEVQIACEICAVWWALSFYDPYLYNSLIELMLSWSILERAAWQFFKWGCFIPLHKVSNFNITRYDLRVRVLNEKALFCILIVILKTAETRSSSVG